MRGWPSAFPTNEGVFVDVCLLHLEGEAAEPVAAVTAGQPELIGAGEMDQGFCSEGAVFKAFGVALPANVAELPAS